jgi:peptide/nickel transport system substrate-binding protein
MLNATGDKGWFGWQDDKTIEEMKAKFAQAGTDAEKKKIAEQLQLRAVETVTHVWLGQFNNPAALRSNISGLVPAGAQVYWNIKKN